MGYQLRMHERIRDWLTRLSDSEPEVARLAGEAVLAMLETGESLGPPLVVPLESVLRPPDDPRETLDYSYQRQLEALTKVRRGVADVATSRKRVELQAAQLEQGAAKLASQGEKALDMGREDLAREARSREAAIREQLSDMRRQLSALAGEEERLTVASQRLQAKVDAFRTRKETIKATYTAEEASQTVREAFASIGEDTSELEATDTASGDVVSASASAGEVLREISDVLQTFEGGSGPGERGDIATARRSRQRARRLAVRGGSAGHGGPSGMGGGSGRIAWPVPGGDTARGGPPGDDSARRSARGGRLYLLRRGIVS
jgi:phage shock protein A